MVGGELCGAKFAGAKQTGRNGSAPLFDKLNTVGAKFPDMLDLTSESDF